MPACSSAVVRFGRAARPRFGWAEVLLVLRLRIPGVSFSHIYITHRKVEMLASILVNDGSRDAEFKPLVVRNQFAGQFEVTREARPRIQVPQFRARIEFLGNHGVATLQHGLDDYSHTNRK
jgi:hypothetical protein